MSKMVSARIPDATFEQASMQLESIDASMTDLINAAFEYLLQEHRLPLTERTSSGSTVRKMSKAQAAEFKSMLDACTMKMDIPSDVAFDKQIILEAKQAKHEALA